MKTLPIVTFLAALAAFLFSPLSFELSASLLFAAGLMTILAGDYAAPRVLPLTVHAGLGVAPRAGSGSVSRLRLAA